MGALTFLIYNENYQIYNIEFTKAFLNMKDFGHDNTSYHVEQSQNINKISKDILKMNLTRSELSNYSIHTFIYKYHRLSINDPSPDGNQPFEDPILHKIKKYPDLRSRPHRKLLCDGEIYNYQELIENEEFNDKDLQSSSDVEVILPLYIKYGIEKTLNMLNGDFSLILTENTNTFVLKDINIFAARDKYGIRPLWYISLNTQNFYMFTSDMCSVPTFIQNDQKYTITEVPPGTYWNFTDKQFHRYTNYVTMQKNIDLNNSLVNIGNKTDPETLNTIYTTIKQLMSNACKIRLCNQNFGILFNQDFIFDSYLLIGLLLQECKNNNNTNEIHIFFTCNNTNIENPDVICYKQLVDFLEKKYNLNLHFHIVIINNHFNIYDYIKDKYNLTLKILFSNYGLNDIWFNKSINNTKIIKRNFEIRFPFLDYHLTDYIQNLDKILKEPRSYKANTKPVDKYIIRKSFDDTNILPTNILWN